MWLLFVSAVTDAVYSHAHWRILSHTTAKNSSSSLSHFANNTQQESEQAA
jgi:hypothetical protein